MPELHAPYQTSEILLVDDDKIALMICERFMVRSGMTTNIKQFQDAKSFLEYADQLDSSESRLVFLDINMPEMSGWQLLDLIAPVEKYDNLMVIILSSSVDAVDIQRSRLYKHVIRYIEKPICVDTFLQLKESPKMEQFFR